MMHERARVGHAMRIPGVKCVFRAHARPSVCGACARLRVRAMCATSPVGHGLVGRGDAVWGYKVLMVF